MELKDRKRIINRLPKYSTGRSPMMAAYDNFNKLYNDNLSYKYQPMEQFKSTFDTSDFARQLPIEIPTRPGMAKLIEPDQLGAFSKSINPVNEITKPSTAELDSLKTKVNSSTTPKASKNVGGKLLGVAQGALGAMQLYGQVSEMSRAKINPEELMMQAGTSNVDIGDGISYERHNQINGSPAMDQVNSEITSGTIGAATTGASTGAAIGSVIPGVGTAVGAVAGGVIGGIAGLFGGSSRRKEEEKRIRHAMLLSKALNDDARMNAFTEKARKLENQKYGDQDEQLLYTYKDGGENINPYTGETYKSHLNDTAFGMMYGPSNAQTKKNEKIVHKEDGQYYVHKVKRGPNDNAYTYLFDTDDVITEKYAPFVEKSIKEGWYNDLLQAQAADRDMKQNRKINKIFKAAKGAEWYTNLIPALSGLLIGNHQYRDAVNQNIFKPDSYKQNRYLGSLADLDKLHIDQLPILQQMRAAQDRTMRALFRSGGLSTGQRATNLIASQHNTQDAIANALASHQQMNNQLKAAAANARLNYGSQEAQRAQQAYQWDADTYAKGHAARQQGMQMGLYNIQNALEQYFANEFKRKQFDRNMNLYEQDLALERNKINKMYGIRV